MNATTILQKCKTHDILGNVVIVEKIVWNEDVMRFKILLKNVCYALKNIFTNKIEIGTFSKYFLI